MTGIFIAHITKPDKAFPNFLKAKQMDF